ncbi:3-Oxoacyl-[acyl-carrier-protein (ACP)] synthase III C terminal [Rhizobium mongolense subsp. loessense]|uniref:3-Oxoacyl-[acyl-carrier-protein (ACP)] synthase III C terminal n=1 Tax=Rhizobium mongolense subsp. loessense TaxID=158890 RepID=A0A1G4UBT9_9HYPH|nr:3-oxoacyl-[acyl-carrier-protein] synthase III C-terminal domain-containing protein [Rhizobium mongolense]SCW91126.1 3-Oxoacyl-[acyl-carrier-protein (ACP)] synthase III C terminal [Rhizobium mongolense subsp. loessense]
MIINNIVAGCPNSCPVPLDALDDSYGLNKGSVAVYNRFYGLQQVVRCEDELPQMLSSVLTRAIEQIPQPLRGSGQLIYCKTQTHNTFCDERWLSTFARDHGLSSWEIYSWAMTNCASALAALHYVATSQAGEPIIIVTGEKAFHPGISRLSVGLLSEAPAAAVLNVNDCGWRILKTRVRHLGQFYQNPENMDAAQKKEFQALYATSLQSFIKESLCAFKEISNDTFVIIPHNLNIPVTRSAIRNLGHEERVFYGDVSNQGHAYCSDAFMNLDMFETSESKPAHTGQQVVLLTAGMGVTFASCLLERVAAAR